MTLKNSPLLNLEQVTIRLDSLLSKYRVCQRCIFIEKCGGDVTELALRYHELTGNNYVYINNREVIKKSQ